MLTIPDEVVDAITIASIGEQLDIISSDQERLTLLYEDGTIAPYQEQDYADNNRILFHLKATYKYFAGYDYVYEDTKSESDGITDQESDDHIST